MNIVDILFLKQKHDWAWYSSEMYPVWETVLFKHYTIKLAKRILKKIVSYTFYKCKIDIININHFITTKDLFTQLFHFFFRVNSDIAVWSRELQCSVVGSIAWDCHYVRETSQSTYISTIGAVIVLAGTGVCFYF